VIGFTYEFQRAFGARLCSLASGAGTTSRDLRAARATQEGDTDVKHPHEGVIHVTRAA